MILLQSAVLLLLYRVGHCLEPTYDVMNLTRQTVRVPEKFINKTSDNALILDPRQHHLSSTNQEQNVFCLKIKQAESPSRKDEKPYVNAEDKTKEEDMVQEDNHQLIFNQERKPDLKTPKRSRRALKGEIEKQAAQYNSEGQKRCCLDGYDYYMEAQECHKRLKEKQKERRPLCYKAFANCCKYSQEYFEKNMAIITFPAYRYCVQMPTFWKLAEPQKVTFVDSQKRSSSNSYLVRMLLLSYPDKNMAYDSKEFLLNPHDIEDPSVSLLFKLEDLPTGDELEKFVYLVTEFKGYTIERKVPVLDLRVTQQDLKKKGSREDLESKINALASKYPQMRKRRACQEAHKHYIKELECQNKLQEMKEKGTPGLYRVFRKCCLYAREYSHKSANNEPNKYMQDECKQVDEELESKFL